MVKQDDSEKIKSFIVRIPKNLWLFLKHESIRRELSMNEIVTILLRKHKKIVDNKS